MNHLVKEFWKSVHICQSYYQTWRKLFLLAHPIYLYLIPFSSYLTLNNVVTWGVTQGHWIDRIVFYCKYGPILYQFRDKARCCDRLTDGHKTQEVGKNIVSEQQLLILQTVTSLTSCCRKIARKLITTLFVSITHLVSTKR